MSDALTGVIIGGIIAGFTPMITVIINHRKWKKEVQIEYLKLKQKNLRDNYKKVLSEFVEAVEKNSYPSDMTSEIIIMMDKNISEKFLEFMSEKNKTEIICKNAHLTLSVEMKKTLKEIENKIEDLISN